MEKKISNAGFSKASTNICKGIAIILMYLHHSFASEGAYSDTNVIFAPFSESFTVSVAQVSKVCVAIFVFLSAYGVYRSSRPLKENESYLQYYSKTVWRRYRTLLAGFMFVYLLSQLLSPLIGQSPADVYGDPGFTRLAYQVIDGLGLAQAFGTPTYNGTWWYMSLAYLLIFVLPLLVVATKKIGWALFPIIILVPMLSGQNMGHIFWRYLPAAVLGLLCAQDAVLERIKGVVKTRKPRCIAYLGCTVLSLGVIAVLAYCRQRLTDYYFLTESILAMAICCFSYLILEEIPLLNRCLEVIGKYSMNMFLIHTLIRSNKMSLHQFSYAPRYPILIILLLVADTLVLSIAIEWAKKLLGSIWKSGCAWLAAKEQHNA